MRFFFDRNMSRYLAQALDKLDRENDVRHHDDDPRFHIRTTDIERITVLAKDDPPWSILSGDGGILKNKAEKKALDEARLNFFCMTRQWSQMGIWEYSWKFIQRWPAIVDHSKHASLRPQIFEVSGGRSGKIDLIRF